MEASDLFALVTSFLVIVSVLALVVLLNRL
jgi:hypothetical protein